MVRPISLTNENPTPLPPLQGNSETPLGIGEPASVIFSAGEAQTPAIKRGCFQKISLWASVFFSALRSCLGKIPFLKYFFSHSIEPISRPLISNPTEVTTRDQRYAGDDKETPSPTAQAVPIPDQNPASFSATSATDQVVIEMGEETSSPTLQAIPTPDQNPVSLSATSATDQVVIEMGEETSSPTLQAIPTPDQNPVSLSATSATDQVVIEMGEETPSPTLQAIPTPDQNPASPLATSATDQVVIEIGEETPSPTAQAIPTPDQNPASPSATSATDQVVIEIGEETPSATAQAVLTPDQNPVINTELSIEQRITSLCQLLADDITEQPDEDFIVTQFSALPTDAKADCFQQLIKCFHCFDSLSNRLFPLLELDTDEKKIQALYEQFTNLDIMQLFDLPTGDQTALSNIQSENQKLYLDNLFDSITTNKITSCFTKLLEIDQSERVIDYFTARFLKLSDQLKDDSKEALFLSMLSDEQKAAWISHCFSQEKGLEYLNFMVTAFSQLTTDNIKRACFRKMLKSDYSTQENLSPFSNCLPSLNTREKKIGEMIQMFTEQGLAAWSDIQILRLNRLFDQLTTDEISSCFETFIQENNNQPIINYFYQRLLKVENERADSIEADFFKRLSDEDKEELLTRYFQDRATRYFDLDFLKKIFRTLTTPEAKIKCFDRIACYETFRLLLPFLPHLKTDDQKIQMLNQLLIEQASESLTLDQQSCIKHLFSSLGQDARAGFFKRYINSTIIDFAMLSGLFFNLKQSLNPEEIIQFFDQIFTRPGDTSLTDPQMIALHIFFQRLSHANQIKCLKKYIIDSENFKESICQFLRRYPEIKLKRFGKEIFTFAFNSFEELKETFQNTFAEQIGKLEPFLN